MHIGTSSILAPTKVPTQEESGPKGKLKKAIFISCFYMLTHPCILKRANSLFTTHTLRRAHCIWASWTNLYFIHLLNTELSKIYSLVIEGLVILDHAIFGSCKIWILQYLDHAIFGSCKIWILQELNRARFGSGMIWIVKDLDRNC